VQAAVISFQGVWPWLILGLGLSLSLSLGLVVCVMLRRSHSRSCSRFVAVCHTPGLWLCVCWVCVDAWVCVRLVRRTHTHSVCTVRSEQRDCFQGVAAGACRCVNGGVGACV